MINKIILLNLYFLTSTDDGGVSKILNSDSNPSFNMFSNESANNAYNETMKLLLNFQPLFRLADFVLFMFFILGIGFIAYAYFGNNGKFKRSGYITIGTSISTYICSHFFVLALTSGSNILVGANIKILIVLLVGQFALYIVGPLIYAQAVVSRQMDEMTEQHELIKQSNIGTPLMIGVMIAAIFFFLIIGVL